MSDRIKELEEKLRAVDGKERVIVLNDLAFAYHLSDPQKMEQYAIEALNLAKELNFRNGIANSYNKIAISYGVRSNEEEAARYTILALEIFQELDDKKNIAACYNNLGMIYHQLRDYETELEYHQKAFAIRQELGDCKGIADSYNNIGTAYYFQKKTDLALEYHLKALQIKTELNDEYGLAHSYGNIGLLLFDTEKYDQAWEYYQKALVIQKKLNDKNGMTLTLIYLGRIKTNLGEFDSALLYLEKSLNIARELEIKNWEVGCYISLSELYERKGDFEQALHYHKQFSVLEKEMLNAEKSKQIAEIRTRYETEQAKKEAEIEHLKNVELAKVNEHLAYLNQEKNELLGIVSHDLKNPLTGIITTAELILWRDFPPEKIKLYAARIRNESYRLIEMLDNLLDVSRLEAGKTIISFDFFDLGQIIAEVTEHYKQTASSKNINIYYECSAQICSVYADKDAVFQIMENLISNAVKYTPTGKNIYIKLLEDNDFVRCLIRDEGLGLTSTDKKKLFGKFARLSARPTGNERSTGLGLFIVKKLVELMKGRVWAESGGRNRGSTFVVELPKSF